MFGARRLFFLWIVPSLLLFTGGVSAVKAQDTTPTPAPVAVTAPGGGEALQGIVAVRGNSTVPGFQSAEIAFAYENDATGTWFLIAQLAASPVDGLLAQWDTTTISDGVYKLRLRILLFDGQVQDAVIRGLRVRNYTAIETSTPEPERETSARTEQPQSAVTSTPLGEFIVPQRTSAVLPTNPVSISRRDLHRSAGMGGLIVFSIFAVTGGYFGLRALRRR